MNKLLAFFLFSIIIPTQLKSQILPKEDTKLNYRIIGFSFPQFKRHNKFTLEIANGRYYSMDSFKNNIIKYIHGNGSKIVAEVPDFNNQYTWRIVSPNLNSSKSKLHHFSTGFVAALDTNKIHVKILKGATKYKDAFIFLDYDRVLYDMAGNPIWYLPKVEDSENEEVLIRDLKMTPYGTITYLIDEKGAYEVNYNGDLIWKAPNDGKVSGDNNEHYHHEFTRLSNGDYMVLAQNFQYWKKPTNGDSALVIIPKDKIKKGETNTAACIRSPMGTLIEYDGHGNIIWSWKSSDYLNGSTIFYRKNAIEGMQVHAHENSFFFDTRSNFVYLSLRNLDKIIKIAYPSGKILNIYDGHNYEPGSNTLFCGQHSCKISQNGLLYLFNNNICDTGAVSSIVMMQESQPGKNTLKKIWEFPCGKNDDNAKCYPSGGNVIELPDSSFFVSTAYPSSTLFIVGMDKKIVWQAKVEMREREGTKWESINIFRASIIINKAQLDKLIWNNEVTR